MRVIHDRENETRAERYSQNAGESVEYQINFDRLSTLRGSSVSSVVWEPVHNIATITNQTLITNVASADITTRNQGKALVKVTATQVDGNIRIKYIEIDSIGPYIGSRDY